MKISIVGVGRVGSTIAYALTMRGLCDELLLVNRRQEHAYGEALDLQHALSFGEKPIAISAATAEETSNSDIIICSASAYIEQARSRDDYALENRALYKKILPPIIKGSPNAIYIMVANPVDVLTYCLIAELGIPWRRVIGSGTMIDSARYRWLLSNEFQVHPQDVRAYILGEHGSTQFAVKSIAQVGGERIADSDRVQRLFHEAVASGMEVHQKKGYTNFAIGSAVAMMVSSIVNNERRTMPLSVWMNDYQGVSDLCLSVPVILGAQGVEKILHPTLNAEETQSFHASARAVRKVIELSLIEGKV